MGKTNISWCDKVWNVVTGCTPISEGCASCYASQMAKRLHAAGNDRYRNGFEVTLHPDRLREPRHWKKPQRIFVVSMGDLFHDDVPDDFILEVIDAMIAAPWHKYYLLTKRPLRMRAILNRILLVEDMAYINVGVTAENQARWDQRVPELDGLPWKTFVSCEPLLGPINIEGFWDSVDWLIAGGESGHKARHMELDWARSLRDQCRTHSIPFFFKQQSGPYPGYKPELDGVVHHEKP